METSRDSWEDNVSELYSNLVISDPRVFIGLCWSFLNQSAVQNNLGMSKKRSNWLSLIMDTCKEDIALCKIKSFQNPTERRLLHQQMWSLLYLPLRVIEERHNEVIVDRKKWSRAQTPAGHQSFKPEPLRTIVGVTCCKCDMKYVKTSVYSMTQQSRLWHNPGAEQEQLF